MTVLEPLKIDVDKAELYAEYYFKDDLESYYQFIEWANKYVVIKEKRLT